MVRRSMRLPKDQILDPEDRTGPGGTPGDDVEGHGMPLTAPPSLDPRTPGHGGEATPTVDDDDVEGHGMPLTAPPSLDRRSPGHGGEATPPVDDVEGHLFH